MPTFNEPPDGSESSVATQPDNEEGFQWKKLAPKIEIIALVLTIVYYLWEFAKAVFPAL